MSNAMDEFKQAPKIVEKKTVALFFQHSSGLHQFVSVTKIISFNF